MLGAAIEGGTKAGLDLAKDADDKPHDVKAGPSDVTPAADVTDGADDEEEKEKPEDEEEEEPKSGTRMVLL